MTVLESVGMLRNSLRYLYLLNYFSFVVCICCLAHLQVFMISFHITLAHASWSLPCEPGPVLWAESPWLLPKTLVFVEFLFCFIFPLQMLSLKSSPQAVFFNWKLPLVSHVLFFYFMYLFGYLHSHLSHVGSAQILKQSKKAALGNIT